MIMIGRINCFWYGYLSGVPRVVHNIVASFVYPSTFSWNYYIPADKCE